MSSNFFLLYIFHFLSLKKYLIFVVKCVLKYSLLHLFVFILNTALYLVVCDGVLDKYNFCICILYFFVKVFAVMFTHDR